MIHENNNEGIHDGYSIPEQKKYTWRRLFSIFLLGQLIAILNSTSSLASEFLESIYKAKIPCMQALLTYVLIFIVYTSYFIYTKKYLSPFKSKRWIAYAIIALFDFEANYLIVKAFQYTNIVSVILLDCFSIPVVMTLSFFLLRVRYRWLHYLSVILCFIGIIVLVLNDLINKTALSGDKPWLGDILVLIAATLYGLSNIGQEIMIKNFEITEFLSMIGLFGALYATIQLLLLELQVIKEIDWTAPTIGLLCAFAITLFVFYSLTPWLFRWTNATLYNLSLLTSDVYGLIYGIFVFHVKVIFISMNFFLFSYLISLIYF
jgi:solute carrier family 35 protein F1/2